MAKLEREYLTLNKVKNKVKYKTQSCWFGFFGEKKTPKKNFGKEQAKELHNIKNLDFTYNFIQKQKKNVNTFF